VDPTRGGYLPAPSDVDWRKYAGTWYEIASVPQVYERGCIAAKAEYYLTSHNTFSVLNTCITNTGSRQINGQAQVTSENTAYVTFEGQTPRNASPSDYDQQRQEPTLVYDPSDSAYEWSGVYPFDDSATPYGAASNFGPTTTTTTTSMMQRRRPNYVVVALDPYYQWAAVGDGNGRAAWVLSRSPYIDPAAYNRAVRILQDYRYPVDRLVKRDPAAWGKQTPTIY
jgi:lipocalin